MKHEVILLTGSWSGECEEVAEFWKELSGRYDILLKVIDVSSKEGAFLMDEYEISSVPVTIIDSEAVFIGMPDLKRAEELLEKD